MDSGFFGKMKETTTPAFASLYNRPSSPPMKYLSCILLSILCSSQAITPIGRSPTFFVSRNLHGSTNGLLHHHQQDRKPTDFAVTIPRGGDNAAELPEDFLAWFRPGATDREKVLALWLLFWNGIALTDALMFTFRPKQNLEGYHTEGWGPHALAQVRMLANCQLALIGTSCLLALTSNETNLKRMFLILIAATLGAFRAVGAGVKEGTIKAPWKTKYASLMTLPPLLLLGYFAFVY